LNKKQLRNGNFLKLLPKTFIVSMRRKYMKGSTLFLVLSATILAAAATVFSQKDQNDVLDIRLNLNIGYPSGGDLTELKKEDVKLFENETEQKITEFSNVGGRLHLGIVVDNTGSMRSSLGFISSISQRLIEALDADDEAFIARFVSSDNVRLLHDWSADRQSLSKSLSLMEAEGGQSAVIDGLYLAADKMAQRRKEDNTGRFAVVLISDCEDRNSRYSQLALYNLAREYGIQIFALSLLDNLSKESGFISKSPKLRAETFANRIVLGTGGAAYFPSGRKTAGKDIDEMLLPLFSEIRSQYIIGYRSTNGKRNNKERKLRVEIALGEKGSTRTGSVRETFLVPSDEKQ
jgi:VWFA-related protein